MTDRKRERRDGWAKDIDVRLQSRDLRLLYALGRMRIAATGDLTELFFPSRTTANDRLRKLACAGYITAHVQALERDNVYRLTARGRDAAASQANIDPSELAVLSKVPARLGHALLVTRVCAALTAASNRGASLTLVGFLFEHEIAAALGGRAGLVIPDALVTLRHASGRTFQVAVEADGATEPLATLADKATRYANLGSNSSGILGAPLNAVLVVAEEYGRLRGISRAVAAHAIDPRFRLIRRRDLTAARALAGSYADAREVARGAPDADAFVRPLVAV